jgi:molybdate transport system ATP-binding protein
MERALTFDVVRRFPRGPVVSARASWSLESAPVTVLFGPSGSGKTTVLRALAGLDRPDDGAITFAGETWFDAARGVHVPPQARGVGLLCQEYALFPHLSVAANIAYGLGRLPRHERESRVAEMAERFAVADLAALAPRPRLLLLDEPLSALDAPTRQTLRGELRRLLEHAGVPAVVVTHDRTEALALGDRLAVLIDGVVRQVGPVHEVFSTPLDAEVARGVGTENVVPARLVGRMDGLVKVRAGEAELTAVDPGGIDEEVFACIRAEEVVLEPAQGGLTSARNALRGTVASLAVEGPLVRVSLECGFRLVALVTRPAAAQLGLAPGRPVTALVKAPAIRLVPRG